MHIGNRKHSIITGLFLQLVLFFQYKVISAEVERAEMLDNVFELTFAPNSNRYLQDTNQTSPSIPSCDESVDDDVRIVVLDVNGVQSPYFNHQVVPIGPYTNDSSCGFQLPNTLTGNMLSILDEMIPCGDMKLYTMHLKNCDNSARDTEWATNVIFGVNWLIDEAKNNPASKYIMVLPFSGDANYPLDQAFINAEINGVATYVSAGNKNEGDSCLLQSPARAAANSTVSTIGGACLNSGNDFTKFRICDFSSYEINNAQDNQCITLNLPGCLYLIDALFGVRVNACSPQFPTIQAAARHAIAQKYFPDHNPQQLKDLLKIGTFKGFDNSKRVQLDLLSPEYVCPKPTLEKALFPTRLHSTIINRKKFPHWYDVSYPNRFCVQFNVRVSRGFFVFKTRSKDNPGKYIIGEIGRIRSGENLERPFVHFIKEVDSSGNVKILNRKVTKHRFIGENPRIFTVRQKNNNFLVQYKNKQGRTLNFLTAAVSNNLDEISFSPYGSWALTIDKTSRCSI